MKMAHAKELCNRGMQLCIVGNRNTTNQVIDKLFGGLSLNQTSYGGAVWTEYNGSKIKEVSMKMAYLKGDTSSIESDTLDASDPPTHGMKRLKTASSRGSFDNGYVSSDNDETIFDNDSHKPMADNTTTLPVSVETPVLVLNIEKNLNRRVILNTLWLLPYPALFIISLDEDTSNKEFYVDFIKELGCYAKMRNDYTSKLLVVDLPTSTTHRTPFPRSDYLDQLQYETLKHHFNINACTMDEVMSKAQHILSGMLEKCSTETTSLRKALERTSRESIFIDRNEAELENEMPLLIKYGLVCLINSKEREYICKSGDLINAFIEVMNVTSTESYAIRSLDFMKGISKFEERMLYIDAFKETGLITEFNETTYILPLIQGECLPGYRNEEKIFTSRVLGLNIDSDILPTSVRANIMSVLLAEGWILKSGGPNDVRESNWYRFEKKDYGLIVQFSTSSEKLPHICLFELANNKPAETEGKSFETIRVKIEEIFGKHTEKSVTNRCEMIITTKQVLSSGKLTRQSITESKNWILVESNGIRQSIDRYELLLPWFYSYVKEQNRKGKLSDGFIADISALFGQGFKLFFVSQEIPFNTVKQIDTPKKETCEVVAELLIQWRQLKGKDASISRLRSALISNEHVTIDLDRFDEIVKRHS